jgi:hypothetical protein
VSVGPDIPERMAVVLMQREGIGWRVGVGSILAAEIDGPSEAFADELAARAAALELSDRLDLMVLRA